jgi:hypothetical protein
VQQPPPSFNVDIAVKPLGTKGIADIQLLIFKPWSQLIPANYSEEELKLISDFYWKKKDEKLS